MTLRMKQLQNPFQPSEPLTHPYLAAGGAARRAVDFPWELRVTPSRYIRPLRKWDFQVSLRAP